jgi:hypothetical protein
MSFGNRSNFCSLKEAFPDIQRPSEKVINPPPTVTFPYVNPTGSMNDSNAGYARVPTAQVAPVPATQHFESREPREPRELRAREPCEQCEYRKKYGHISTGFNEMLNLLLLLLLLYIVIYKPKI